MFFEGFWWCVLQLWLMSFGLCLSLSIPKNRIWWKLGLHPFLGWELCTSWVCLERAYLSHYRPTGPVIEVNFFLTQSFNHWTSRCTELSCFWWNHRTNSIYECSFECWVMDRALKLVILSSSEIRIWCKHHNIMSTGIFISYLQLENV
jgi:hypothetical protein